MLILINQLLRVAQYACSLNDLLLKHVTFSEVKKRLNMPQNSVFSLTVLLDFLLEDKNKNLRVRDYDPTTAADVVKLNELRDWLFLVTKDEKFQNPEYEILLTDLYQIGSFPCTSTNGYRDIVNKWLHLHYNIFDLSYHITVTGLTSDINKFATSLKTQLNLMFTKWVCVTCPMYYSSKTHAVSEICSRPQKAERYEDIEKRADQLAFEHEEYLEYVKTSQPWNPSRIT
jgi:hypothetical protein